jgi:hypothetical protein
MVWWEIIKERDSSEIDGRKLSELFVKKKRFGTQT